MAWHEISDLKVEEFVCLWYRWTAVVVQYYSAAVSRLSAEFLGHYTLSKQFKGVKNHRGT